MVVLACLTTAVVGGVDIAAAAALSQSGDDPAISELRVQVMPEFDDPRVLAIIQGRLDVAVDDLPVTLTLPVPRGAQINQMAIMNTGTGAIESQPFDAAPDPDNDDWTLVTYELNSAHFFYEYYYAPFTLADPEREFTFTFPTPYEVQGLQIEVQQPLEATDFTLVPPAVLASSDENLGFTYHLYEFSSLAADDEVEVTITYRKTTDEPSVTREQLSGAGMPSGDGDETASPAADNDNAAVYGTLLGLGVLGAIGVVVFLWMRSDRDPSPSGSGRATGHAASRAKAVPPTRSARGAGGNRTEGEDDADTSDEVVFCTECGTKLRPDAHFCHNCGSRTD